MSCPSLIASTNVFSTSSLLSNMIPTSYIPQSSPLPMTLQVCFDCMNDALVSSEIQSFANSLLSQFKLGPIVFITPELGKWSTVGGLGTIVDLLSHAIAKQNQEVIVISPYYDRDRKGNQEYLILIISYCLVIWRRTTSSTRIRLTSVHLTMWTIHSESTKDIWTTSITTSITILSSTEDLIHLETTSSWWRVFCCKLCDDHE